MFTIGLFGVCCPLIWAIEPLNKPLGQKAFKVSQENDVIFAVEVNPAVVAVLGIMALRLAGCCAIEDLVERLAMDVAKSDIEILAEWHVTITVDDKATHDALAAQT